MDHEKLYEWPEFDRTGPQVAVAGVDFVWVAPEREFEVQGLLHLRAWQFYIHEHVRRLGQDVQRLTYVAMHWLRLMGPEPDVNKWKRRDVARFPEARLAAGIRAVTIWRDQAMMRSCLSHNKKWERIQNIPHFEKPAGEYRKRRPLTLEEAKRVMRQPMDGRIRRFFALAFWTGHRARAIEELTWDRINWTDRVIDFNVPGRRRHNKRRAEAFPIPDELYVRLEQWYASRKDDYVIGLGPRGKPSTTFHECKAVLIAAGINEPGICRHTFRKTFVTERIKAGFQRNFIAGLIADSPTTMDRNYVLLSAEDMRAAANLKIAA